jgi:hypothetical protein
LQRDGAVVIDGPECGEHASRKLAHEIFAERTLAVPEAARVFEGGEYDHARTQVTNHIATPSTYRRLCLWRLLSRLHDAQLYSRMRCRRRKRFD